LIGSDAAHQLHLSVSLIKNPADARLNDTLPEELPGNPVEPLHGGEILRKARRKKETSGRGRADRRHRKWYRVESSG